MLIKRVVCLLRVVWPVSIRVNQEWCGLSVCVLIKSGVFLTSGVSCQYAVN